MISTTAVTEVKPPVADPEIVFIGLPDEDIEFLAMEERMFGKSSYDEFANFEQAANEALHTLF